MRRKHLLFWISFIYFRNKIEKVDNACKALKDCNKCGCIWHATFSSMVQFSTKHIKFSDYNRWWNDIIMHLTQKRVEQPGRDEHSLVATSELKGFVFKPQCCYRSPKPWSADHCILYIQYNLDSRHVSVLIYSIFYLFGSLRAWIVSLSASMKSSAVWLAVLAV